MQKHRLALAILAAMAQFPVSSQTVASPHAAQGASPISDVTRNGVGIVHITAPNPSGVSHNQFQHFNVPAGGLILNNSTQPSVTVLGGGVAGNPQLGSLPARLIVNEVISASPSIMRGALEVAGSRADIVVANPNGIHCDGCGFLNAGRVTLATGAPEWNEAGGVQGFRVERGVLSVGSGGMNAQDLHQLDLLARGIVVEGSVQSQRIRAISGANLVTYNEGGTPEVHQALEGHGDAPKFAVDIGALGGMYAGQIYLVATDQGMGVNSAGRLIAREGALHLQSDGHLHIHDAFAQQGMHVASAGGEIELTGEVVSPAAVQIFAGKLVRNAGLLAAGEGLSVQASRIENGGSLVGGVANPRLQNLGAKSEQAGHGVHLSGEVSNGADALIFSAGHLSIDGSLRNVGGRVHSEDNITVSGLISNENADLRTVRESSITAAHEVYYADELAPGHMQRASDVRFDRQHRLVLASEQFPFEQFGHEAIEPVWLPGSQFSLTKTPEARYKDSDPIWERFGVKPPDFSDLRELAPLPGVGICTHNSTPSANGPCNQYPEAAQMYAEAVNARRALSMAELQLKLDAFNADLEHRRTSRYVSRTIDQRQITEDRVIASHPGQVIARGAISVGGGINRDSVLSAGGQFMSFGAFDNQATVGRGTVVAEGRIRRTGSDASHPQGDGSHSSEPVLFASLDSEQSFPLDIRAAGVDSSHMRSAYTRGATSSGESLPHLTEVMQHGWSSRAAIPHIRVADETRGSLLAGSDIHILAPGQEVRNGGAMIAHGSGTSPGRINVDAADITHQGSMAAQHTLLRATQDIVVTGGKIHPVGNELGDTRSVLKAGRNIELSSALRKTMESHGSAQVEAYLSQQTTQVSARNVELLAGQDVLTQGASIQAGDSLEAHAGRDMHIATAYESRTTQVNPGLNEQGGAFLWRESEGRALGTHLSAAGVANLSAGRHLSFTGSELGSQGDLHLRARNISIEAAGIQHTLSLQTDQARNPLHAQTSRHSATPSVLTAERSVTLIAEKDIDVLGSQVLAQHGQALVSAGQDLAIQGVVTVSSNQASHDSPGGAWLSFNEGSSRRSSHGNAIHSSQVEGNRISFNAGGDVKIRGSSVTSENALNVIAGGHISLTAMQSASEESVGSREATRGAFWLGNMLTLGWKDKTKDIHTGTGTTERGSIGSLNASVQIDAAGAYTQAASDLLAAEDITVRAKDIHLSEMEEAHRKAEHRTESGTGGSISLGAFGFLGLTHTAYTNAKSAFHAGSGRVAMLHTLAALRGAKITKGMLYSKQDQDGKTTPAAVGTWSGLLGGVRMGLQWSDFSISSQKLSDVPQTAEINGGGKVHLMADEQAGILRTAGASVQGGHVNMSASQIELGAARAHEHLEAADTTHAAGAGANLGASWGGDAFYSFAAHTTRESRSRPRSTRISAQETLSVRGPQHVRLQGAVLEADSIALSAGTELLIDSLQDTATVSSDNTAADPAFWSGDGMVFTGAGGGQGAGQSEYAAVTLRSGILAGRGGFDIHVDGTTRIAGGFVDSLAPAQNNQIVSGHLETRDIVNSRAHNARGVDGYAGYDTYFPGNIHGGWSLIPNAPLVDQGRKTSETRVVIAPGAITLTKETPSAAAEQIEKLNRDAASERLQVVLDLPADPGKLLLQHGALIWAIGASIPPRQMADWAAFADARLLQAQAGGNQVLAHCWSAHGSCRALGVEGFNALIGKLGLH
ncbi:two-partner secretion domain-containing protein [Ottowia thiooxydans]|uniref:Filamentous hemagglutinin family protein n=1 Tax=Ottowia thiooxydans TaxID=219182 RepID=A0ABV2QE51_9BURK